MTAGLVYTAMYSAAVSRSKSRISGDLGLEKRGGWTGREGTKRQRLECSTVRFFNCGFSLIGRTEKKDLEEKYHPLSSGDEQTSELLKKNFLCP